MTSGDGAGDKLPHVTPVSDMRLHFTLYLKMIGNMIAGIANLMLFPPYMAQNTSLIPIIDLQKLL